MRDKKEVLSERFIMPNSTAKKLQTINQTIKLFQSCYMALKGYGTRPSVILMLV